MSPKAISGDHRHTFIELLISTSCGETPYNIIDYLSICWRNGFDIGIISTKIKTKCLCQPLEQLLEIDKSFIKPYSAVCHFKAQNHTKRTC